LLQIIKIITEIKSGYAADSLIAWNHCRINILSCTLVLDMFWTVLYYPYLSSVQRCILPWFLAH